MHNKLSHFALYIANKFYNDVFGWGFAKMECTISVGDIDYTIAYIDSIFVGHLFGVKAV
jgi:predicted enzyme related to lactoylglutathione lyase